MFLNVRVIPRAKIQRLVPGDPLRVYVNQPREAGRANGAVIKLLAEYFDVPKSQIKIIKGEKSRNKIIEINNPRTQRSKVEGLH